MTELLPPLHILCTTYYPPDERGPLRLGITLRAIESWLAHFVYDGRVAILMADDGSPDDMLTSLIRDVRMRAVSRGWDVYGHQQERHGVGASLNAGFERSAIESAFVLHAVDDWALTRPLDLTPYARMLQRDETIGCVRLGPPHPWLTGRIEGGPPLEDWILRLDRHHYVDSMRPSLFHPRFWWAYGPYAEGVSAYDAERMHNEHFCTTSGPDIVLALPTPFDHLGGVELGDIDPSKER